LQRNGWRTSFINAWNVGGAFITPNDITRNSKRPSCVQKAVFSASVGSIKT
jgi:hypothetical protein